MDEQRIREIIREELVSLIKSDRYVFEKDIQILDGRSIQLASGTGTKIGTAAAQKLGFWNATPVVQPSGYTTAPTGTLTRTTFATGTATLTQVAERLGALITDLRTIGITGV